MTKYISHFHNRRRRATTEVVVFGGIDRGVIQREANLGDHDVVLVEVAIVILRRVRAEQKALNRIVTIL